MFGFLAFLKSLPWLGKLGGLSAVAPWLALVPRPVWYGLGAGVLLWGAYVKGTWDERAEWRARVDRLEATNMQLTRQLNEAAEAQQQLAEEAQKANDELAQRLESNPDRDLFPDDWLRELNRTR